MEWASPNLAAQVAWLEHLGTAPGAEELYQTLAVETVPAPADRWFYAPLPVS